MDIYVEAVLGINFGTNLVLLWLCGRCLGLASGPARLAAAAALGAGYALAVLAWPQAGLGGWPAKLLAGAAMLGLAYRPRGLRSWFRLASVFALTSTAVAGFMIAGAGGDGAATAVGGGAIVLGRPAREALFWSLLVAAGVSIGAGRALAFAARGRAGWAEAVVEVDGRKVGFRGLIDTGNQLCEPVSGLPVLVAEAGVLASLVPGEWRTALVLGPASLGWAQDPAWHSRLCLVPFRAVGTRRGVLVGFRPDRVEILTPAGLRRSTSAVVVAASPDRLGDNYRGLIPASILA